MVNDAENTRKSIDKKLSGVSANLQWVLGRKKILLILSGVLMLINIAQFYATRHVYLLLNVPSVLLLAITWLAYVCWKKYLQWSKKKLE